MTGPPSFPSKMAPPVVTGQAGLLLWGISVLFARPPLGDAAGHLGDAAGHRHWVWLVFRKFSMFKWALLLVAGGAPRRALEG